MKNIYEVVKAKEIQVAQLVKEIDALRAAIQIMEASEDKEGAPNMASPANGRGIDFPPRTVKAVSSLP